MTTQRNSDLNATIEHVFERAFTSPPGGVTYFDEKNMVDAMYAIASGLRDVASAILGNPREGLK